MPFGVIPSAADLICSSASFQVTPEGETESVEFGAGDLVVFPDGMSCTWKVSEAVHKHYRFD